MAYLPDCAADIPDIIYDYLHFICNYLCHPGYLRKKRPQVKGSAIPQLITQEHWLYGQPTPCNAETHDKNLIQNHIHQQGFSQ
ncbi:hypothetical protein SK128_005892 [Halocaridina rubra]|uniref:Uncharacterized protein n=1 Tax=Halocaridina rubra TaxID=373956 RepID=A0AAN8XFP1_HALRR